MSDSQTCVIYGTDTGNTEDVARRIAERLDHLGLGVDMHDVDAFDIAKLQNYEFLILGIPTWDYGGIQADWEELEQNLSKVDLSGKVIALYGLGDQTGYADYYVDAMGWLREQLDESNASFVGSWSTAGYEFTASRAVNEDKTHFVGLALDEDGQSDKTDERIDQWIDQILSEYIQSIG